MTTEYPAKNCEIDRLVRHPKLVAAALSGQKTEQRRDGIYAYPGERFELEGVEFVVTDVVRERIGDMTDDNARAEGYPNLAMYKQLILSMHANMQWDDDGLVWVHRFKRNQPE